MAGFRPLAISLHRLFSGFALNANKEELENSIVHGSMKVIGVSPEKKSFKLDLKLQERISEENEEMNQLLSEFLENFKVSSPKKHNTVPEIVNQMRLKSPGLSTLKKRRNTMILKK